MAYRFRRLGGLSRVLLGRFHSGSMSRRKLPTNFTPTSLHQSQPMRDRTMEIRSNVCWCSILPETQYDLVPEAEICRFIKSMVTELEGPNHRWLNCMDGNIEAFNQQGIFLVLVNAYMVDSALPGHRDRIMMFERVKSLQQRYPMLNFLGLQLGSSVNSVATQSQIIETIMEEYITFPILVLDKNPTEMTNGACYLLFDGSSNRFRYHKVDVELEDIVKAIEEFGVLHKDSSVRVQSSNGDRLKQHEAIKEPDDFSFRNLLLYYPGCVSVDEDGGRIFLSDSNHHRIIISDSHGKILDSIGSSPGFEDGEFESAKLFRPAASFFNIDDNCLYFVDSENHAIRRADMQRRVLETMHPVGVSKSSGIWSWIMDKLGLAREVDVRREEFNVEALSFPWHMLQYGENDLLVINRSFEMSWIMSMTTWEIRNVTTGVSNLLENYGHVILEKVSLLRDIYETWSKHMLRNCLSIEGIPYAGLISSVANFQGYTVLCDTAGHRVLKCHRESRCVSNVQFSDLRILGLPYWLIYPLERVFNRGYICRPWKEYLRHFSVLPGKCDIRVNIDIPKDTEVATPLEEDCIWRQVRGSIAEISGSEGSATTEEKVGVAQQWFDELDNLAFANSGVELDLPVKENFAQRSFQNTGKVHLDCAVNSSPGTGEVVISAVLYLKLNKEQGLKEERSSAAARILGLQKKGNRKPEEDACIGLLSETCADLQGVVFMKPFHLRVRLDCADHPPSLTPNKETIITDTKLEVDLSLD